MAQFTGSGTCVSVSAGIPATHDATGFAALTYTALGELESVGTIDVAYAAVAFANLCSGKTTRIKGVEEAIDFDITVAMDRDDAGQAIMATAHNSRTATVSVKILESSGDVAYLRAFVMRARMAGGAGINDVRMNVYGLGVVAPASGNTVVIVNAA